MAQTDMVSTADDIRRQLLLTPAAIMRAEAEAIAGGVPGIVLMEEAGLAITRAITAHFRPGPVLALCGPGNNGGDGYVVARRLQAAGWPVRLASMVPPDQLHGDAALAAQRWPGPVEPLESAEPDSAAVIVDALFGAGLSRAITGPAAELIERLRPHAAKVVAVDVPSGVDGANGQVLGAAVQAVLTVTFTCRKPGHLLLPGQLHCGELVVADIGLPAAPVLAQDDGLRLNSPHLWGPHWRWRTPTSHKYDFGHAVVIGGGAWTTGAARLVARAALRVGAGLVSVATDRAAQPIYAAALTTVMTKPCDNPSDLAQLLADRRLNAWAIGPGAGVSNETRDRTLALLRSGRPTVVDADALTVFADAPGDLFDALHPECVLTPHEGEFARLFQHQGDRLHRARQAAVQAKAVLVLKGGDTIVAAPDGRAALIEQAPPYLATAGTGDVLAGLIVGLLAQGMPAYHAAAAGVWLHARLGEAAGPGLIAEDLPDLLPALLQAGLEQGWGGHTGRS